MTEFSGDWTALAKGTRVRPYLNGEPYGGDVWILSFNPDINARALIEGEAGSGIGSRQILRSDGWELSRA